MPKRHKVLITGSGGMLGADLWDELKESYDITGLDVAQAEGRGPFIICDITDKDALVAAAAKAGPEAIVHCAAWTDVDGCELDKNKAYRVNRDGARNAASAAEKAGSALIYISTDFVFDGKKKKPYTEDDPTVPLSVYGSSKLAGETAVRKMCKRHFILRTSWLYGKRGKNFVDTILSKARTDTMLRVVDDQIGSPTYTKDLAKAIHALLEKIFSHNSQLTTQYGIYHVSNSGSVSWYEYAKEILRTAGSGVGVVPVSSAELNRPAARPAMSVLDNTKFNKFTGFEMRPWREALREYLKTK